MRPLQQLDKLVEGEADPAVLRYVSLAVYQLQERDVDILVERAWQSQPLDRSHCPGLPQFLTIAGTDCVGVLDYPLSPPLVAHSEVWVILEVPLGLYQKAFLFLFCDQSFSP